MNRDFSQPWVGSIITDGSLTMILDGIYSCYCYNKQIFFWPLQWKAHCIFVSRPDRYLFGQFGTFVFSFPQWLSISIMTTSQSHNITIVCRYVKSVSQPASQPASSLPRKNKMKKATQEKRQERKAAKTLSAILLVFILTWTPYNVLAVMKGILGPEQSEVRTWWNGKVISL